MSSYKIVLVFDIILLIFGLYACAAAMRMKKTGVPSEILIPKEEQRCLKDAPQFCGKMYLPTVLFGCLSCVYGAFDFINRQALKVPLWSMWEWFVFWAGVIGMCGSCWR